MKLLNPLFFILVLLFSTSCFASNYILSNSDSLNISWTKVNPDYEQEIITYNIFVEIQDDTGDYFIWQHNISDTTVIINLAALPDGIYKVGVQAQDDTGNRSTTLWSDSELNKYGSWLYRRDTGVQMPTGIRGIFK